MVMLGKLEKMSEDIERKVEKWRDDIDVRVKRIGRKIEEKMVVEIEGREMGDGVGEGFFGDVDKMIGDKWEGNRCEEKIEELIEGIGEENREEEIEKELLEKVINEDLIDEKNLRFIEGRLKLIEMEEIRGKGKELREKLSMKKIKDDRGVEEERIGEKEFIKVFKIDNS